MASSTDGSARSVNIVCTLIDLKSVNGSVEQQAIYNFDEVQGYLRL